MVEKENMAGLRHIHMAPADPRVAELLAEVEQLRKERDEARAAVEQLRGALEEAKANVERVTDGGRTAVPDLQAWLRRARAAVAKARGEVGDE